MQSQRGQLVSVKRRTVNLGYLSSLVPCDRDPEADPLARLFVVPVKDAFPGSPSEAAGLPSRSPDPVTVTKDLFRQPPASLHLPSGQSIHSTFSRRVAAE